MEATGRGRKRGARPCRLPVPFQIEVETGDKLAVRIEKADGEKCERCWNYSTHVGESQRYPTVCERCVAALEEIENSR